MKTPDKSKSPAIPSEFSPLSVARMLWNRRWLAIAVWVVATVGAVVAVRYIQPLYKADVLVLADSQKIPDRFVASTVDEDLADTLALISQEIMSRTRLTKIIDMFDLYKKERQTKTREEVIQQMRTDISLKVERGSGAGKMGAFRLGYQGGDPVVVAAVANELANLYVTENLRSREDQAEGTVKFLQTQLEAAKKSLNEQEAKVSEFKQRYNGVLPEQENSLLASLSNLRLQLGGSQDALNREQAEEDMTQTALSSAELSEAALARSVRPRFANSIESAGSPVSLPRTRSEQIQAQLQDLLQRYTPEYPAVQALQKQLREALRDEQQAAVMLAAKPAKASSVTSQNPVNLDQISTITPELLRERERIAELKTRLTNIRRNIALQNQAREQAIAQIAAVEERVNRLPLVEQQMAALTRDYEISQQNYKSLLDKELAAGIATQMERSQKSERFTVMDPARVPEKPFKPKRLTIEAGGSLGGLVFGALLAIGWEWRKKRLLGEWELPPDIPILGRVPRIQIASKALDFSRTGAARSGALYVLFLLPASLVGWAGLAG